MRQESGPFDDDHVGPFYLLLLSYLQEFMSACDLTLEAHEECPGCDLCKELSAMHLMASYFESSLSSTVIMDWVPRWEDSKAQAQAALADALAIPPQERRWKCVDELRAELRAAAEVDGLTAADLADPRDNPPAAATPPAGGLPAAKGRPYWIQ
jgi:hypothetical protein